MRRWGYTGFLAIAATLGGCAATTPTSKVAVDYNRIFANARNEVLVTNILRAAAREPLQFSTMGDVTGGVRNTGSLTLSIPSLIGKGATILSPEFSVNEGINPNVSIVPLSSKEFTEGILRPVTLDEINYFIDQGWDQELILELVVGGIVCPDGTVVFNRGYPKSDGHYDDFAQMFASADRFPIQDVDKPNPKVIRLSASDAVAIMKDGVGTSRRVANVVPVMENGHPTGPVDVTVKSTPQQQLTGLRTTKICSAETKGTRRGPAAPDKGLVEISPVGGTRQGKVILRSVEAIVYFLGETQSWRWSEAGACGRSTTDAVWPYYWRIRPVNGVDQWQQRTLLRVDKACAKQPVPFRSFVQTHFNDEYYYIRRQSDAGESDRSLSTLSLLNELIALQTSESTIAAGAPIIAIGTK